MSVPAAALCLAVAATAWAQAQFAPRIGYVYPAGGRQGTTFQVTIGGQRLEGAAAISVSGGGVQAKVLEYAKPLTPKQATDLRERLQELQKKDKDAEVRKEIADIVKRLLAFRSKAGPAIAETVTVEISLAADAAPGDRQLRLTAATGLSNPLIFCVGQLPEFRKDNARRVGPADGGAGAPGQERRATPLKPDFKTATPVVLNGQIMPGEVDRYRFTARKGQRLVVAAKARDLIPYLADAVPGWFQATLTLYDAKAIEVAYNENYRFHADPALLYEVPADGEYVLEVRDALWRGREDFVYRIAVGELPFVTGIFPLGGKVGTQTAVEVAGWNLPASRLQHDNQAPGIHPISVRQGGLISNAEPFAVDTLPECTEKEPNGDAASAQAVTLPIIVNGRVDRPGDCDVFRFEGRAGDEVVAEVYARRLDSPLDSLLRLTDSAGKQLASNDDFEDKGSGLNTHHADSYIRAALPAKGTFYLYLGDAQRKGGPEYAYRLRISAPRPDFELRVVPSAVNVRPGATVPLAVYALRRDGFAGEIRLVLKGAPPGFALAGACVPGGQDQVWATLTAPPSSSRELVTLGLEGRAVVGSTEVVRSAVPADDLMQAFAYHHLVPADSLQVCVAGRFAPRTVARVLSATPIRIPAGGNARLQVTLPSSPFFGNVQFELSQPPPGVSVESVSPGRASADIVLRSDAAKVKPGLKGNLIVGAYATRTPPAGETPEKPGPSEKTDKAAESQPTPKPTAALRRIPLDTLPAIPFEITAPPAGPANVTPG
jgi:hypothetical protein